MPRSLKRQLMKSAKESRRRIAVQEERLAADASVAAAETAREGAESLVSSDSEAAEGAGRDAVEGVEVEAAGDFPGCRNCRPSAPAWRPSNVLCDTGCIEMCDEQVEGDAESSVWMP